MRFYLGTHEPGWLWHLSVPLFVSRRRLERCKSFWPATCKWALDSGGFSELSMFGEWTITPEQYVDEVRAWSGEMGHLEWAAIMDHMCEPDILKKTGGSVESHQRATIESLITLRTLAPEVKWAPVLQGWAIDDYRRHVDAYLAAGFDLESEPVVGIGSVCRRQHTVEVEELIIELARGGLNIHGFGFKTKGLKRAGQWMVSSDSMAWSLAARFMDPLPECTHKSCGNCKRWALKWRRKVLDGSHNLPPEANHVETIRLLGKPEVVKASEVSPLQFREQVSQMPDAVGYIQTQIAYWPVGSAVGPFGSLVPEGCIARGSEGGYGKFSIDFLPCFGCSVGPDCFAKTMKLNPQAVLLVHKKRIRKPRTEAGKEVTSRRRKAKYDPNPFRPSDDLNKKYYNAFRSILGLVGSDTYRRKRKVEWFSVDDLLLCCDDSDMSEAFVHSMCQYVAEVHDVPDELDCDAAMMAHWRTVFEEYEFTKGLRFSPSAVRKMDREIRGGVHVKASE